MFAKGRSRIFGEMPNDLNGRQLASVAKRFVAYLIDDIALCVIYSLIMIIILECYGDSVATTPTIVLMLVQYIPLFLLIGAWNFFLFPVVWLTNGYTLGKKLMKIRVVRRDGKKLTFWNCLLRDGLMKGLVSVVTSGLLNLVSFIWMAGHTARKTVADTVAKTYVVEAEL